MRSTEASVLKKKIDETATMTEKNIDCMGKLTISKTRMFQNEIDWPSRCRALKEQLENKIRAKEELLKQSKETEEAL